MQCNTRRNLFTSLVGTVPLNDVLADLPLPTPLRTPMEETVLGLRKMSHESRKLLDSTNPALCSRITEALLAVDTSFLDLKDPAQTVPYTPNAKDPPLIKMVMANLLPQAVVKVERIDPGLISSAAPSISVSPTTEKQDAVVPESVKIPKSQPQTKKKRKRNSSSATGRARTKKPRRLSSSSDETDKPVIIPVTTASCNSLRISIDRYPLQVSSLQSNPSRPQKLSLKKQQKGQSSSAQNLGSLTSSSLTSSNLTSSGLTSSSLTSSSLTSSSLTSCSLTSSSLTSSSLTSPSLTSSSLTSSCLTSSCLTSCLTSSCLTSSSLTSSSLTSSSLTSSTPNIPCSLDPLTIKLPRGRLKGYFGLPYSGAVHSVVDVSSNQVRVPLVDVLEADPCRSFNYEEFAVVPGPDSAQPKPVSKKKRKRQSHHRGNQAKVAHLSRFVNMVEGLFDQNTSDDGLLGQAVISEVLAQVSSLKQRGVLHEVSVESLVQLIGIMDKHLLDSTNLLVHVIPESVEGGGKMWRELVKDRILCSADAALIILHIITAPHMPKKVHIEESVDQVLALTKFHLENNVYPQFDPVYKAENKDSGVLPRHKRRSGAAQTTASKITNAVYHKLTEVVENMATLTEAQPLTDTTVLMLSSMGTLPFFVENVSLLQLSAMRLVRAIFSRYDKHRDLILEEIFASLQRLPSNKRNLRNYKLSSGQHIQMLTALVLQLIQCTVTAPEVTKGNRAMSSNKSKEGDKQVGDKQVGDKQVGDKQVGDKKSEDVDAQMTCAYNLAMTTANNFLSKFLKKCSSGKDEDDFRPLFENFVQDLLTTLNLPMWPASEVLLTLLGKLLVQTFSNRSMELSLRLMSLEHLGVIAARLRKDTTAPTSEQENEQLVDIIAQVMELKMDARSPSPTLLLKMDAFSENNQHLQKVLVAYLNKQTESDQACAYARDFYIGQWLYDTHLQLEKTLKDKTTSPTEKRNLGELSKDSLTDPGEISSSCLALQQSELKKEKILALLVSNKKLSFKPLTCILDEHSAPLVARYLASSRALTRSFDLYLQKLMWVSNEPAVHVRTRAMKALSSIIAADPSILSRPDMQRAVEIRFRDTSTLVREAAVDLIGRFVLCKPKLTLQYYDMICERIRDSGVSVRKRVIKILKDICILQPDFPKVNDICVRIIRRISDEEAIRQLVTSVFRELWFTTVHDSHNQKTLLLKRVTNITAVVGICKEYEWFEQLLEQILKNEDQVTTQAVFQVCQMMVDSLVENVLTLDENSAKSSSSSAGLMSCIITLYLFCSVKPSLLLKHATTLHPYLSSSCAANKDVMVLHFVSKILKEVVPLMEHPAQSFLTGLEEDLVKLIMKHGQLLIHSSVECLGAVVNSVTHNYALVTDCFQRFFKCLEQMRALQTQNMTSPQLKTHRHSLLRSLFTVGVLCKFFDFDTIMPCQSGDSPLSTEVYSHLIYFFKNGDEEIQIKTVKGLGLFCIRYPEMMLESEMRDIINDWLTKDCASTKKVEVLRNLHNYLKEVETQLKVADIKWGKERSGKENLLEFGDRQSSVSSNIAQAFLHPMLEAFLHPDLQVRFGAVQAVLLILRQGLVHPAQCVPYLIAMSTDPDSTIKVKADQHLGDHTSRYGHMMQTQLLSGVRKSCEFQKIIAGDGARGFLTDNTGNCSSGLSHVYSLVRSSKQQRRMFLAALLRHFEEYEKNGLDLLLYFADTLAFLPYNTVEEPLFVVHHIDMTISITGTNLLQQFKEAIGTKSSTEPADEDDISVLLQKSCNLMFMSDCCLASQGCYLLLLLKQHIQKSFGLSDSKCQKYSPTEPNKANDKTANRRGGIVFEPDQVVEMVKQQAITTDKVVLSKEESIRQYLEFKKLMNKLDPFEADENGSDQEVPPTASTLSSQNQKIEDSLRSSVHSHSSRGSSNNTMSSRREKRDRESKKKKKRRIIVSSDSSGDDDPTWS